MVKVTRNVAQHTLHHVTYAPAKIKAAMANVLGGDTISRKVTEGWTDRRTKGQLRYKINIPFLFERKKWVQIIRPFILNQLCNNRTILTILTFILNSSHVLNEMGQGWTCQAWYFQTPDL